VNKPGARRSLAGFGFARSRIHAIIDFPLGSLDFGFEFVADLQLVFDEIVQPGAHGLQIGLRKAGKGRLDFLNAAQAKPWWILSNDSSYQRDQREKPAA
jgi:hypothetical protein